MYAYIHTYMYTYQTLVWAEISFSLFSNYGSLGIKETPGASVLSLLKETINPNFNYRNLWKDENGRKS